MSNTTYNRDKVEKFKLAFQEYQTAKETFKEEMQQFQSTMEFMSGVNDGDIATSADSAGNGYVINDNGILMKVSGDSETTYDSSVNNVVDIGSKKAFVTDVEYQGTENSAISNISETNKLYQVGLNDLTYDQDIENVVTNDFKYVTTTKQPEISASTDCNLNHLAQCSSRAKMENKPYYGIGGGTDSASVSICNCYIFDEQPTDIAAERIKTITVDTDSTDSAAYLATLMDGNFYKIHKSIYSDNYTAFYEYDTTEDSNLTKLIDGGYTDSTVGLNPFVGNGINSIQIKELGESSCAAKTS